MVWITISSREIIGPFFGLETVTEAKYLDIGLEFVTIQMTLEVGISSYRFMQDGTQPLRTVSVLDFLSELFNDHAVIDTIRVLLLILLGKNTSLTVV
ncbi:hypothetical protein TNCV_4720161 [Trichonephila clavipes]|uniref:Uncharacterized protein n=1 Tax=Trichonephila clavipes TaxID=2585209 RepID=A0A8X6W6B0_TRICX|nr:hypothetical protein TNCV_4720161 [Trichonephila clavipes]